MKQFVREVDVAFDTFSNNWREERSRIAELLEEHRHVFLESYRRLVSLQAWRAELLEGQISAGSLGFFTEAQNDGLISHVLGSLGSWRSALKSLRSCIENACMCIYYKDHPVELELWHQGKHVTSFAWLMEYVVKHPAGRCAILS